MKPVPASAVGAIHRLAFVVDGDEAVEQVKEAIRRGADPFSALDALALWLRVRDADATYLHTSDAMRDA